MPRLKVKAAGRPKKKKEKKGSKRLGNYRTKYSKTISRRPCRQQKMTGCL